MSPNLIAKLLLLLVFLGAQAHAVDMIYPLITYKCDSDTDSAIVTNTLIKDGTGKTYSFSEAEGKYSPWDLVEIEHASDRSRIIDTSSVTRTCKLSSGEYSITIEPQLFGRVLDGRCGASISAALTITIDGVEILERTPFESFCLGNAPVITEVKLLGKTGEVETKRTPKYRFY